MSLFTKGLKCFDDLDPKKIKCLNVDNRGQEEVKEEQERREFIFVVDRGQSMLKSMGCTREALILFLLSLPADCRFNIFSIGST